MNMECLDLQTMPMDFGTSPESCRVSKLYIQKSKPLSLSLSIYIYISPSMKSFRDLGFTAFGV